MDRIGVIGGGAWGTALASVAARSGRDTLLWAREPDVVAAINDDHENSLFLKGVALPPALAASGDMAAMADRDAVLLVCPAQFLRPVTGALAPHIRPGLPLVICAKGIELSSLKLLTTVLAETVPGAVPAVLSGPTFASEVARGLPTAVTLACADRDIGEALVATLGQRNFRPYLADDLMGAEIGGAIKNVLAIASGIVIGRQMGRNAHAALITRGMAEMLRLGARLGARAETLMGLCGLGDLILTCSSEQSRNMSLGMALGRGESLADIMAGRHTVAEGVPTAEAVTALAGKLSVDMPICRAVAAILAGRERVGEAIDELLSRPFTVEATGEEIDGPPA